MVKLFFSLKRVNNILLIFLSIKDRKIGKKLSVKTLTNGHIFKTEFCDIFDGIGHTVFNPEH